MPHVNPPRMPLSVQQQIAALKRRIAEASIYSEQEDERGLSSSGEEATLPAWPGAASARINRVSTNE